MTPRESATGFQVNQDLAFQQRDWKVQRIGWIAMLLMILAALTGAFGHGPLGRAEAGRVGGLRVQYERLTRHGSSSYLRIHLPAIQGPGEARVWLDRRYADGVRIESIVPEPESVELTPERVMYTFRLGPGAQAARITFDVTPMAMWSKTATLGLEGGEMLTFSQFVYP